LKNKYIHERCFFRILAAVESKILVPVQRARESTIEPNINDVAYDSVTLTKIV